MNDLVRFANSVEYTTGKKRGRHPVFNSNMFYPYKAERRLQAATKKEFETYILEAYEVAVVGETFTQDSLEDLSNLPERISEGFRQEISYAADSIAKKAASNIANMSEMVVGRPYYPPTAKESLLKDWQANFQTLCKSAESDAKKEISRLVQQAKDEGWNRKQLERAVKKQLPEKYASRAALIARTESAKLNTQVTLSTYKEIGVEYYVWMSAMDERTRPEHAMMNGLICSATDPTVWYEENPEDPMHPIEHKRDDTMVHLHPGEDYQCRCTMVMWDPVIDGKYEVKEGEKQEEPEEEPEKEPESPELKEANERLAKQEKELEKAENERKTAEKELAQEKSARKAAEKSAAEAEKRAAKAEQRAENSEKTAKTEEHRREILQKANRRHEKRTQAQAQAIQYRWNLRKDERTYDSEHRQLFNEIEKDLGVKRGLSMSHLEANSGLENPNYSKGYLFTKNCQLCTVAYMLRRWGFDVSAKSLREFVASGVKWEYRFLEKDGTPIKSMFADWNSFRYWEGKNADLGKFFKQQTDKDGVYEVYCEWKSGGAHVFNAVKENGILIYHDPQSGTPFTLAELEQNIKKSGGLYVIRVDNKIVERRLLNAFQSK